MYFPETFDATIGLHPEYLLNVFIASSLVMYRAFPVFTNSSATSFRNTDSAKSLLCKAKQTLGPTATFFEFFIRDESFA